MPPFSCQRCHQPLRIDESLLDLDPSSAELLIGPLVAEEQYMASQSTSYYDTGAAANAADLTPSAAISTKNVLGSTGPASHSAQHAHNQQPQQQTDPSSLSLQRAGLPVADSFVMLSKSQVPIIATPPSRPITHRYSSPLANDASSAALGTSPTQQQQQQPRHWLTAGLSSSPPASTSTMAATTGAKAGNAAATATASMSAAAAAAKKKQHRHSGSYGSSVSASGAVGAGAQEKGQAHDDHSASENNGSSASDLLIERNNSLSHRLKVAARLFDVMSSKSSIDHPMCQECTDIMLENLERQLNDINLERDCYLDFLKNIKQEQEMPSSPVNSSFAAALSSSPPPNTTISSPSSSSSTATTATHTVKDMEQLQKQVKQLQAQEQQAMAKLDAMRAEYDDLEDQYKQLQHESDLLDAEEQQFWQECNQYQLRYQQFQNERDTINIKYDHDVRQLERLQKTVVYNDAFCIVQDGPFGTINGYRLGRLHSHPVEWSEINAAWGQTLLLLYTVANKLKFQFQSYRLVPMGSFSKVEKVDGDVVVSYELYGSGDYGINRMLFLNRRFDHAMVAVLNCLKQLSDYAERKDRNIRLPYRINKDKIGELSIRLQFNQDELWTKALRYMLTNMKWILIFASRAGTAVES
ncbi:autophagy protein Apg6-domain-containing protein [Gongronella butleri]|nr:autophagy protein Apg6-domain-containing protein [Gongronella butleri]